MALLVADFYEVCHVTSIRELEVALGRRYGPCANHFWISHDQEKNPTLAMFVKGDLASLTYFPNDSHPGFTSIGAIEGLNPDETSIFYMDSPTQEQEVLNSSIVTFPTALNVAREFFSSKELPRAIQWFEL